MKHIYCIFFSLTTVITIFITIFQTQSMNIEISKEYVWPTPSFYQISSYFGYRDKPTQNASSYHQGVDILAPEGSGVLAIAKGMVSYARMEYIWRVYGTN